MTELSQGALAPVSHAARLRILATLCAVYVVSQFFRASHAVVGPDLVREFGLSPADLGTLTGAFFFAFAAAQIAIGLLLDRFGARRAVGSLLLIAILGAVLFAQASSMFELTVARILMGLGCASVLVGAHVVCTRWFPPDRHATIAGIIIGGGEVGNLLAATPFAALSEAVGWRDAFLLTALLAAGLTALAWFGVKDSPPGHPPHTAKGERLGDTLRGLREVLTTPAIWPVIVIAFVGYSSVMCVFGLWGAPYLHDVYGLDPVERGNIMAVMATAMLIGSIGFGPLDRHFDTRKGVVLTSCLALAACFALLAILQAPPLWAVTALFALIGVLGGHRVAMMAHGRALFPIRLVGRTVTSVNTSMMGGVAVLQTLTGTLVGLVAGGAAGGAGAYSVVFGSLAAIILAACFVYARVEDRRPSQDRRSH
ncbi:MAG: MFS transporter [Alphaproteobacteria bacterium]